MDPLPAVKNLPLEDFPLRHLGEINFYPLKQFVLASSDARSRLIDVSTFVKNIILIEIEYRQKQHLPLAWQILTDVQSKKYTKNCTSVSKTFDRVVQQWLDKMFPEKIRRDIDKCYALTAILLNEVFSAMMSLDKLRSSKNSESNAVEFYGNMLNVIVIKIYTTVGAIYGTSDRYVDMLVKFLKKIQNLLSTYQIYDEQLQFVDQGIAGAEDLCGLNEDESREQALFKRVMFSYICLPYLIDTEQLISDPQTLPVLLEPIKKRASTTLYFALLDGKIARSLIYSGHVDRIAEQDESTWMQIKTYQYNNVPTTFLPLQCQLLINSELWMYYWAKANPASSEFTAQPCLFISSFSIPPLIKKMAKIAAVTNHEQIVHLLQDNFFITYELSKAMLLIEYRKYKLVKLNTVETDLQRIDARESFQNPTFAGETFSTISSVSLPQDPMSWPTFLDANCVLLSNRTYYAPVLLFIMKRLAVYFVSNESEVNNNPIGKFKNSKTPISVANYVKSVSDMVSAGNQILTMRASNTVNTFANRQQQQQILRTATNAVAMQAVANPSAALARKSAEIATQANSVYQDFAAQTAFPPVFVPNQPPNSPPPPFRPPNRQPPPFQPPSWAPPPEQPTGNMPPAYSPPPNYIDFDPSPSYAPRPPNREPPPFRPPNRQPPPFQPPNWPPPPEQQREDTPPIYSPPAVPSYIDFDPFPTHYPRPRQRSETPPPAYQPPLLPQVFKPTSNPAERMSEPSRFLNPTQRTQLPIPVPWSPPPSIGRGQIHHPLPSQQEEESRPPISTSSSEPEENELETERRLSEMQNHIWGRQRNLSPVEKFESVSRKRPRLPPSRELPNLKVDPYSLPASPWGSTNPAEPMYAPQPFGNPKSGRKGPQVPTGPFPSHAMTRPTWREIVPQIVDEEAEPERITTPPLTEEEQLRALNAEIYDLPPPKRTTVPRAKIPQRTTQQNEELRPQEPMQPTWQTLRTRDLAPQLPSAPGRAHNFYPDFPKSASPSPQGRQPARPSSSASSSQSGTVSFPARATGNESILSKGKAILLSSELRDFLNSNPSGRLPPRRDPSFEALSQIQEDRSPINPIRSRFPPLDPEVLATVDGVYDCLRECTDPGISRGPINDKLLKTVLDTINDLFEMPALVDYLTIHKGELAVTKILDIDNCRNILNNNTSGSRGGYTKWFKEWLSQPVILFDDYLGPDISKLFYILQIHILFNTKDQIVEYIHNLAADMVAFTLKSKTPQDRIEALIDDELCKMEFWFGKALLATQIYCKYRHYVPTLPISDIVQKILLLNNLGTSDLFHLLNSILATTDPTKIFSDLGREIFLIRNNETRSIEGYQYPYVALAFDMDEKKTQLELLGIPQGQNSSQSLDAQLNELCKGTARKPMKPFIAKSFEPGAYRAFMNFKKCLSPILKNEAKYSAMETIRSNFFLDYEFLESPNNGVINRADLYLLENALALEILYYVCVSKLLSVASGEANQTSKAEETLFTRDPKTKNDLSKMCMLLLYNNLYNENPSYTDSKMMEILLGLR